MGGSLPHSSGDETARQQIARLLPLALLVVLVIAVRWREVAARRAAEREAFSAADKEIEPPEALRYCPL